MSKIVPWVTPFTEIEHPSVGIYVEHGEYEADFITAIVAPNGIEEYPKYLVNFGTVYEVKLYEEGFSPERGYESLLGTVKGLSTCEWLESPSIKSYQNLEESCKLKHYILFGGDNTLEIVTQNPPKIIKVSKPTAIKIEINI